MEDRNIRHRNHLRRTVEKGSWVHFQLEEGNNRLEEDNNQLEEGNNRPVELSHLQLEEGNKGTDTASPIWL